MGWFDHEQPLPTPTRIVLTTLWSLLGVFSITSMVWYYRVRHSAVIMHRSPLVMLVSVSLFAFNQFINQLIAVVWMPTINCDGSGPMYFFTQAAFLAFWVMSLWRLLHLIVLAEAQQLRAALKLVEEGFDAPFKYADLSWFQRRGLYYLTSWTTVALLAVLAIVPPLVRTLWFPLQFPADGTCTLDDYAMSVVQLVIAILMVLCAFRVRTIDDGFYIVRELKLQGIGAIVHGVLFGIIQATEPQFVFSAAGQVYLLIVITTAIYITFVIPVRLTQNWANRPAGSTKQRKNRAAGAGTGSLLKKDGTGGGGEADGNERSAVRSVKGEQSTNGNSIQLLIPVELTTLSSVLRLRPARRAFMAHLSTEFAIEGLTFVDEIDLLKSEAVTEISLVEANQRATAIYRKFIAVGAPFEINISHGCATALHAIFHPKNSADGTAAGGLRRKYLLRSGHSMSSLARHANIHLTGTATGRHPSPAAGSAAARQLTINQTGAGTGTAASSPAIGALTASPLQTVAEAKDARRHEKRKSISTNAMTFGGRDRTAAFYVSAFDTARMEVFNLLENDSFPRFQRSELFESLVRNMALATELQRIANPNQINTRTNGTTAATDAAIAAAEAASAVGLMSTSPVAVAPSRSPRAATRAAATGAGATDTIKSVADAASGIVSIDVKEQPPLPANLIIGASPRATADKRVPRPAAINPSPRTQHRQHLLDPANSDRSAYNTSLVVPLPTPLSTATTVALSTPSTSSLSLAVVQSGPHTGTSPLVSTERARIADAPADPATGASPTVLTLPPPAGNGTTAGTAPAPTVPSPLTPNRAAPIRRFKTGAAAAAAGGGSPAAPSAAPSLPP